MNALLFCWQSPPSHSDVLSSSAERQTWLTLCAAQAAAPGPNQTSPTRQPFKCPVRSSSAMTLLLTHHTLMGLCRCRRRGRARSFARTFVPLCAICAEQQKSHETAASSRRCAERRGPVCPRFPENTAVRRSHAVPSLLRGTTAAAVLTAVIFTASVIIIITPVQPR